LAFGISAQEVINVENKKLINTETKNPISTGKKGSKQLKEILCLNQDSHQKPHQSE
jgi:hypothetical protein